MIQHRLHLNITDLCNLRCKHCYWEAYGVSPDAPLAKLETILERFKAFAADYGETGEHVLTIGGGEPTLRPDLDDILRAASKRGFLPRLVTNAVSIDAARARSLAEAGLRVMQVSLDGACKETHESVRGQGTWKRTMAGIEALREAGVFVVLSYVLLPGVNLDEAPTLLDLVERMNLSGAKFARPILQGQAIKHAVAVEGDYLATFRKIVRHAHETNYKRALLFFDPLAHGLRLDVPEWTSELPGLATDLCQCDETALVEVDAGSGAIYYCRVREKLGNIWEDDLGTVWREHKLLRGIRERKPEGACSSCAAWSNCRGGCPAVVYGLTGETIAPDGDCHKVAAHSGA
ncbi:MAG TPA: radical SAM protein [Oscillatoriaceae cyanobacterium]